MRMLCRVECHSWINSFRCFLAASIRMILNIRTSGKNIRCLCAHLNLNFRVLFFSASFQLLILWDKKSLDRRKYFYHLRTRNRKSQRKGPIKQSRKGQEIVCPMENEVIVVDLRSVLHRLPEIKFKVLRTMRRGANFYWYILFTYYE